jgi:hypothetical protein
MIQATTTTTNPVNRTPVFAFAYHVMHHVWSIKTTISAPGCNPMISAPA